MAWSLVAREVQRVWWHAQALLAPCQCSRVCNLVAIRYTNLARFVLCHGHAGNLIAGQHVRGLRTRLAPTAASPLHAYAAATCVAVHDSSSLTLAAQRRPLRGLEHVNRATTCHAADPSTQHSKRSVHVKMCACVCVCLGQCNNNKPLSGGGLAGERASIHTYTSPLPRTHARAHTHPQSHSDAHIVAYEMGCIFTAPMLTCDCNNKYPLEWEARVARAARYYQMFCAVRALVFTCRRGPGTCAHHGPCPSCPSCLHHPAQRT